MKRALALGLCMLSILLAPGTAGAAPFDPSAQHQSCSEKVKGTITCTDLRKGEVSSYTYLGGACENPLAPPGYRQLYRVPIYRDDTEYTVYRGGRVVENYTVPGQTYTGNPEPVVCIPDSPG